MAFSDNVSFCRVTYKLATGEADSFDAGQEPNAEPIAGQTVRLRASVPRVVNATSNPPVTHYMKEFVYTTNLQGELVNVDGTVGAYIIATDDPDLQPTGWTWTAVVSGNGYAPDTFSFVAPSNGHIDLSTVPRVPLSPGSEVAAWAAAQVVALSAVQATEAARDATLIARNQVEALAGTNNQQIAAIVETTGPTRDAVTALVESEVAPIADAAVADAIGEVVIEANVAPAQAIEQDEFEVRFDDGDPFIRANETEGIHDTRIAGNDIVSTGKGWVWRIGVGTPDGSVYTQIGQREDGTYYPDALNGSAPTVAPVVIEGTSLVANWNSSVAPLSEGLGRAVVVRGNGGQRSMWVAARDGGEPLRVAVTGGKIPSSGAVATTSTYVPIEPNATAALLPALSLVGSLAGIAGTLTFDSAGAGTFTRSAPGTPTKVPASTPFITGAEVRHAWPILWLARNNFKQSGDPAQVVRDIRRILAYKTDDARAHALILSEPPWPGEYAGGQYPGVRTALDNVTTAQRDAFPTMFLDTAAMLRDTDRLLSVGITPTQTDLDMIAADATPPSFQTEDGHLNAAAYQALNQIIIETYASRGWIS